MVKPNKIIARYFMCEACTNMNLRLQQNEVFESRLPIQYSATPLPFIQNNITIRTR